jgi:hypothetical protein
MRVWLSLLVSYGHSKLVFEFKILRMSRGCCECCVPGGRDLGGDGRRPRSVVLASAMKV